MKTNFLRMAMLFAVSITLLTSCNNDDDPVAVSPAPAFFNLNVGNQWVYKKYTYNQMDGYVYSGIIDSVEVINIAPLNGFDYAEIRHKRTNNPFPSFEYMRVDASGHLVGYSEHTDPEAGSEPSVFHPGSDSVYFQDITYDFGTLHFFLAPMVTISVEGSPYTVSPFKGNFTPSGSTTVTKTTEYDYKPLVGLVKQVIHHVAGDDFYEERLVSYHVN